MHRINIVIVGWIGLTFGAMTAPWASASDWPQWRGPTRDGAYVGPRWPESIGGDNLQQVWRVELGEGYPGPIVTDDRVFTVESDDGDEIVRAFDRLTGAPLWEHAWKGAMKVPFFAASNGSWVRSTPAWDGERLYVGGMLDVLECLDGSTGRSVWRKDFVAELGTPLPSFGNVSSPLIDGDTLYTQAGASVVKLDKHTGRVIWRALDDEGGMDGSAFSSPIIAEIAGRRQLLVQTRTTLAGLGLDSGELLWAMPVKAFRGMNILTPVVYGDGVLTSSYGGKTQFHRVIKQGDRYAVGTVWTNKLQGYMSSPVIVGGYAYMHLKNQRFSCVELESGKIMWTSGSGFGKYCSLIVQGDRVLALDERGDLLLIRATPEKFDLISRHKVSRESTWAHLGVADQHVFVRELKALAVYEWKHVPDSGVVSTGLFPGKPVVGVTKRVRLVGPRMRR